MSRLIDADKLKEAISKSTCHCAERLWKQVVCDVIDNQPTAYNVDKVVAELEEESFPTHENHSAIWLDTVLEVVRKGGVE